MECHRLDEHLARVALVSHRLFGPRLRVSQGPLARLRTILEDVLPEAPEAILVLASLFHDVGKASHGYKLPSRVGEVMGYSMHEHVSAHTIGLASLEMMEQEPRCSWALHLVAAVVARHHTAMECRHPDDLPIARSPWTRRGAKCRSAMRRLTTALNGFSPARALDGVPTPARGLAGRILRSPDTASISKVLLLTQTRGLQDLASKMRGEGVEGARSWLLPSVQALAGALIVGDILVAWRERCGREECREPDKVYARSWLGELDASKLLDEAVEMSAGDAVGELGGLLDLWRGGCLG